MLDPPHTHEVGSEERPFVADVGSLAPFHIWSGSILVMRPNAEVYMAGSLSRVGVTVFVASSPGDGGSIPPQASKGNVPLLWLHATFLNLSFRVRVPEWWLFLSILS